MTETNPVLTIGLVVFNGADHLRKALDSLLAQDFTDYELHIFDNGSTDDTFQICLEYVARDERVFYHRSEENVGPVANFNRAYAVRHSKYFMFAPDDDTREPSFLSKCVRALDENPQAVLSFTYFDTITPGGQCDSVVDDELETTALDVRARFRHVVTHIGWCSTIFGVMRSNAIDRPNLFLNIPAPDTVVLFQLALVGSFVKVRETLYHRQMAASDYLPPPSKRELWNTLEPANKNQCAFRPTTWLVLEMVRFILRLEVGIFTRLALVADALRYWKVPLVSEWAHLTWTGCRRMLSLFKASAPLEH